MQGLFLEITSEKKIVWKYKNILPSLINNAVAKIQRYPLDYPGIRKTININQNGKSIDDFTNKIKFELQ
jgi:hypothetical protein